MTTPTKAAELAQELREWADSAYATQISSDLHSIADRIDLLRANEGRVPDAVFASGAYDAAVDDFENDQGDIPAEKIKQFVQRLFAAAPHPPAQQAWCWVISGSEQIWRGPDAQEDAEREARRVGGSCRAFALYASPPPHKAEGAEQ